MSNQPTTVFEAAGGAETFRKLVTAFYLRVAADPDLSPIFPEDFTLIREKQYAFLTQFFGGPALYAKTYGPPMLRARHLPFPVTKRRVQAWLSCMSEAMDEIGLQGELRDFMFERLTLTAHHMMNTDEEGESDPSRPMLKVEARQHPREQDEQ